MFPYSSQRNANHESHILHLQIIFLILYISGKTHDEVYTTGNCMLLELLEILVFPKGSTRTVLQNILYTLRRSSLTDKTYTLFRVTYCKSDFFSRWPLPEHDYRTQYSQNVHDYAQRPHVTWFIIFLWAKHLWGWVDRHRTQWWDDMGSGAPAQSQYVYGHIKRVFFLYEWQQAHPKAFSPT